MPEYTPELGQAAFGNPTGEYDCPEYVDAFVAALINEIHRVFWNREQRKWDEYEDPKIPGIEFRPYSWSDCDCGYEQLEWAWEDENLPDLPEGRYTYPPEIEEKWLAWLATHHHKATCTPCLPNLKFGEGEIRWYKHPGRGMSVNVDWSPDQWSQWFMQAIEQIREADRVAL